MLLYGVFQFILVPRFSILLVNFVHVLVWVVSVTSCIQTLCVNSYFRPLHREVTTKSLDVLPEAV
jgi:hypothetical protein